MNKEVLITMRSIGNDIVHNVYNAIKDLTAENPLIVFNKEEADVDNVLDLPYSFNVDKYGTYEQGAIYKVEGENVELFLTGDNWGQIYHTELCWIPFEQQLDLLNYLAERMQS
jgi:hypothetical protein